MVIDQLCVIGVGLIGGSLARALKSAGAVREIVGHGRDRGSLERALELGVIDRFETDIQQAVSEADVILIATPVGTMQSILEAIKGHIRPDAIITDVGSTKGSVVHAAQQVFSNVPANFVPGHPIAGTEKSGVEAAFATLYQDRRVILTPLAQTSPQALARVRWMWEQAGAVVEHMGVMHHDEVLAATSHLPHVLAFTLVDTLARLDEKVDIFRYAAGGFRDFTRIASSDPSMWSDICLANREAVLKVLDHFNEDLRLLTQAIADGDQEKLLKTFQRAKASRDSFCEKATYSEE